jgi:hypothetical protein
MLEERRETICPVTTKRAADGKENFVSVERCATVEESGASAMNLHCDLISEPFMSKSLCVAGFFYVLSLSEIDQWPLRERWM